MKFVMFAMLVGLLVALEIECRIDEAEGEAQSIDEED